MEKMQDEAELLDEFEGGAVDGHAQVANEDTAKEHKGRSQRDAEYLDIAQHDTHRDDDGIYQNGVGHTVTYP